MRHKIKNLQYLNKYVNLESLMKEVVDDASEGKTLEGFQKLKEFVKTLAVELVRYNSLFKDVAFPGFDTILEELRKKDLLTEDQKDLLYSINEYNPLKQVKNYDRQNKESLKNFYVRLDNELPSIMAHLGVGGSSNDIFEDEIEKDFEEIAAIAKRQAERNNQSSVKTKEKVNVNTKTKTPLSKKLKNAYNSTPGFVIRFIFIGGLAGVLVYFTFINKLTSEILNDFYSEGIDEIGYAWQYIAVTMFEKLILFFKSIFDGLAGIFNFLKFE